MNTKRLMLIIGLVLSVGLAKSEIITVVRLPFGGDLDLNQDGHYEYSGSANPIRSLDGQIIGDQIFIYGVYSGTNANARVCLASRGAFIGQSSVPYYQSTSFSSYSSSSNYVGFELVISGTTNYGWASVEPARGSRVSFTTSAYQTIPGRGIYVGATNEPAITMTRLGNSQIHLSWPFGALQSASSPRGPFADVLNATSPFAVNPTNSSAFYRLRLGAP